MSDDSTKCFVTKCTGLKKHFHLASKAHGPRTNNSTESVGMSALIVIDIVIGAVHSYYSFYGEHISHF